MGHYYPWASLEYLLDKMSVEEIFIYYDKMVEAVTGKNNDPDPDIEALKKIYPELGRGGKVVKR